MKIGYARVSTEDQKLDLQIDALKKAGCVEIYSDHAVSGGSFNRPGLTKALDSLQGGDTLVVWRLDRLGRSLIHLVQLINELGTRDVHFQSLSELIDTASSGGRLVFHMMAALAEFVRSLISERTRAGMAAARRIGRHMGRKPILSDEELRSAAYAVSHQGAHLSDVAKRHGLAPRSLRRMIQARVHGK
ncbi:DNA resolvase [Hoeflea sp. BAL378]|uniref:recombinase family protein n=1 Tax=Hoeflea sp. BAL378 TaxID=1547437 RepID=UPI0005129EE3|nr:recombinase family protein [Hoeflea sp. BAL378]KGF68059.1 DNA resolvase [Hoeflea sp. BAL378]